MDKKVSVHVWGVDEIEKKYNHFLESGAIEHEKPHSVGKPLIVALVTDPWRNIIGLIYNSVFKQNKKREKRIEIIKSQIL